MLATVLLALALTGDTSLTIHGLGLTRHGLDQSQFAASQMPNKLTDSGQWVWHPEIGLTLKTDHMQVGALYLQDCFDNPAGTIFIGPKVDFLKFFSVGGIAGVYVRKAPNQDLIRVPNKVGSFETGKFNDMPLSTHIKGAEVSPLVAATASVTIPVYKNVGLEFNVMSNIYITHGNVGLKFTFK